MKKYPFAAKNMKNANYVSRKIVSIPFFPFMENKEKQKIVEKSTDLK